MQAADSIQFSGRLTILVTGQTGVGKSSLINGIVGKEIAKEGDISFNLGRGVTEGVHFYFEKIRGNRVTVIDSPGLDSPEQDEVMKLATLTGGHVDVVLFCVSLNNRIESIVSSIKCLSEQFTARVWERTVFVITCANEFRQPRDKEDSVESFKQMLDSFTSGIQRNLERAGIFQDNITVVPAGYYLSSPQDINAHNQWMLPGYGNDWLSTLWTACANNLTGEALKCVEALATLKRIPRNVSEENDIG